MNDFLLTYEELSPTGFSTLTGDDSLGGHVVFIGTVRGSASGKPVVKLEFEAYDSMALAELEKIADVIRMRWPVENIRLHHRLGEVSCGGIAVIAAVSSPHRKEAFEACAFLMDQLKSIVPIWKKEVFSDGYSWVSSTP